VTAPRAAASDDRTDAYSELEPALAADRRTSDALAAIVAETIGVDIFITDREYLYKMTWKLADGVTYCGLDDALTVVGLYLRSQGEFIISCDPAGRGTHTMNRGLYYWVGTRELLPSAWRWFLRMRPALKGCPRRHRAAPRAIGVAADAAWAAGPG